MGCEICGRSSCTRSFHSLREQSEFDNNADEIKERAKRVILTRLDRIKGVYDEDDVYWVKIDDVISVVENYS